VDKTTAQALMKAVLSLAGPMGKIDALVSEMTNLEEKKVWISRLGELLRLHDEEFVRPIVREFPDLNPV
jgi:hypothetical protein